VACGDSAGVKAESTQHLSLFGNNCSAGGKLEEGLDFFLRRGSDNDGVEVRSSVALTFGEPSFLT
jgi:hypothetical protein